MTVLIVIIVNKLLTHGPLRAFCVRGTGSVLNHRTAQTDQYCIGLIYFSLDRSNTSINTESHEIHSEVILINLSP